jgi:hypothetical protein
MKIFWHVVTLAILLLTILIPGCFSDFKPVDRQNTTGNATVTTMEMDLITTTPDILDTKIPVTTGTPVQPLIVTTIATQQESGKILVDESYSLSINEYREYKFSDLGYAFLYEGDRFQFSITSEKPVMVYIVGYMDSIRIQASDGTPHYEVGNPNLQWGNVKPAFYWERVTDKIATFRITEVGKYSFVVDPRWMTYDEDWKTRRSFSYKLRITRL